ncbi:MAG: hypothetical protein ABI690_05300 [Chloroflexota bacterium]
MFENFGELVAQLYGQDMSAAIRAAEALGKSGDPRAHKILEDRIAPYRFMGSNTDAQNVFYFTLALVLAEMGSFHAYRIVVDEDAPFVRSRVVEMLERVGKVRAINAAMRMLSSSDAGERYWAASILGVLKATTASSALLHAQANEESYGVRREMLFALINASDREAIPTLEALQNDKDEEIRRICGLALEKWKATDP